MKRKWIRLLAPLAAVLSVALTLPLMSSAVDLEKTCSLTVNLTSSKDPELTEDLESADIVIDVYWIAKAVSYQENGMTYDAYRFEAFDAYKTLDLTEKAEEEGWEIWQEQAQGAAQIALIDRPENAEPFAHITIDKNDPAKPGNVITSLSPGLYLLVPHGKELTAEEYVRILTEDLEFNKMTADDEKKPDTGDDSDADGKDFSVTKGEGTISTIAYSDEYCYSFLPELVAVPNKEATVGYPTTSAADRGPWLYDFEIYLKPARELRYGSLEIIKNLPTYETWDYTVEEVTFVFQIEAERKGKTVYSDVESLTFSAAGEKRVKIENKIPAGATVRVTEIYSGASYVQDGTPAWQKTDQEGNVTGVGDEDGDHVISATDLLGVRFTNTYDRDQRGGHGIINHFEPRMDASGNWIYEWSNADDSLGLPQTASGQNEDQTGSGSTEGTESGSAGSEGNESGTSSESEQVSGSASGTESEVSGENQGN